MRVCMYVRIHPCLYVCLYVMQQDQQVRGDEPLGKDDGHTPTQSSKKRRADKQTACAVEIAKRSSASSTPKGKIMISIPQGMQTALNREFARTVVVHDLRATTLSEGPGCQQFMKAVQGACGATHQWNPPSHQAVSDVLKNDFEDMLKRMQDRVRSCPIEQRLVHTDVWEDCLHRHWLGVSFAWLKVVHLKSPGCSLALSCWEIGSAMMLVPCTQLRLQLPQSSRKETT